MSNEANKHKDQAEHLKQLFHEVQQSEKAEESVSKELTANDTESEHLKIDVLNLPPRKEVHKDHDSRMRLKLSKPFLRFISVVIILFIITICIYIFWGEELIPLINDL